MRISRIASVLLIAILLLTGCLQANGESVSGSGYENAKIGILTGSSHEATVKREFPNAERVYFTMSTDLVLAVEQGKIDCYVEDAPYLTAAIWEGAKVRREGEAVTQVNNGIIFQQSEDSRDLRMQMNEFIAESKDNGTIEQLKQKWLADKEPTEHPDYSNLSGENGTIRVAVVVDSKPMVYKYYNQITGLEMELVTLFAQKYGYALQIQEVPFDSIIAGIAVGKYDMGLSGMNITPEREESIDFSDPYAEFDTVMVVKADNGAGSGKITKLEDLKNVRIGILVGSFCDQIAAEKYPDCERKYYSAHADMITSLAQGKIDVIFEDKLVLVPMQWEGAQVKALEEPLTSSELALIFAKGAENSDLYRQMNEFIAAKKEDGTLKKLEEKWLAASEPTEHPDYRKLTGENGTLKIAVSASIKPVSYLRGESYTGIEVEFMTLFAEEYGYQLNIEGMAFDALIPSIASGKFDIGASGISVTPERAESVLFTDSHISTYGVAIVYDGKAAEVVEESFIDGLKEDFEKTFIREDRWKLIVEGVGVTMLISILSAAGGSLLGFGLYMLGRSTNKLLRGVAHGIAKVYSRIIAGTPVVVILMILFYVVFAAVRDMSGIVVAIIGFSLTFGAFVVDHMTVSVDSVDKGQTEAAYALGYPRGKTFFRIILPQAMRIFLPSYCGEVVSLVKATAVVGYIAVNDLTKMGDIIRSNTYEAFFPLIATALIYFMLTWILASLLQCVKLHFEPKRRSAAVILKGVNGK